MSKLKLALPAAVLGGLALMPLSASASSDWDSRDEPRIYLGGGVGYNWLNGQPFRNSNGNFSDSHDTWKGFVGLRFNDVLSVESQYIDFGAHRQDNDNVKAHGWTTGVVLDLPVSPAVTPYGKAGALFWNSDGTFTSNGTLTGSGFDQNGTDFTWGGGVRFRLARNLDLRVEYERFRLDNAHVDNAAAAIQFNF